MRIIYKSAKRFNLMEVGKWNDLRNTNSSGATYQPRGYVLETDQGKLLGVMPQAISNWKT